MLPATLFFTFDPKKAAANLRKHGVDFAEAMSVFGDRLAATLPDEQHSGEEERLITLGMSAKRRILYVVHSYDGERIRLISARVVTSVEACQYEEE